ncbi:ATP-binding protein [Rhodoferax sp. TS-BS-61-7]|uniref:ATP-binding protein n=1 Tax=Rhodoferax sp. TS-BS-61-7 TaxID=2094194 RepID=UPI001F4166ED|nr:ATP-binding protein [Rhodoferax sp. TS-BS-61-7]
MQKYIVGTHSIDQLYMRIKKCIKLRVPGSIVYARTRYGKTYACRYVASALKSDFPNIVTFTFSCHKRKVPSESAFFTNLLFAIGHAESEKGTAPRKRIRLINTLILQLAKSRQNILVVFADEAQKLELDEYEWLREVHDELERRGYRMITFLVGQPQLKNQKTSLKEARQTQIVGRFMIDDIEFRGVCSAEEAASCLLGYDDTCYPADSDWSFTRFFLPLAWSRGVRLSPQAGVLWQQFEDAHREGGYRTTVEVPMTYFARTVEIALTDLCQDSKDFQFTPVLWKKAIEESRFSLAEEELLLDMDPDNAS